MKMRKTGQFYQKNVAFVKCSIRNVERVIDTEILVANALWEIIYRIVIKPLILRICIADLLPWLQNMEISRFSKYHFQK